MSEDFKVNKEICMVIKYAQSKPPDQIGHPTKQTKNEINSKSILNLNEN
jgi:hypothetical protein